MNKVSVVNSKLCFGCRSCEKSCPKNAIKMEYDDEGFLFPIITESCIDCGICYKRCPSIIYNNKDSNNINNKNLGAYALVLKDKKILANSASGGAFAGIAKYILLNGGDVFGCAFDEEFNVKQIKISDLNELTKLQGSKYVFSDTADTYKEVKILLDNGKTVLYSGCPCQVAGLLLFLNKDYENLITIDLICHGTPSQKFFKLYINWLERRIKTPILDYSFRSKKMSGWNLVGYVAGNGVLKKLDNHNDPYFAAFYRAENYKEKCYTCPFATSKRVGDITIGDFWGIENFFPNINSSEGVSCCIVNTNKGLACIEKLSSNFDFYETKLEHIQRKNGQLISPTKRPVNRDDFYKNVYNKGIKTIKINNKLKEKIIISFLSLFPRRLKDFVKEILRHV